MKLHVLTRGPIDARARTEMPAVGIIVTSGPMP